MKIVNRSQTSALLRKFGFRTFRDLGQNFLIDANILRKILADAELTSDDIVLEVGTGIGTLTEALAERVSRVITVEIDKRLAPILAATLADFNNVDILIMDAMDLKPAQTAMGGRLATKLVANLPYNVAAPLILKYFIKFKDIRVMTVMVQREIAHRILAEVGSKDYSGFTVKLKYFCRAEWLMSVSRHVFMPQPNVDSVVIRLTRWEKPPIEADRVRLFALITAGFSQRRKKLINALVSSDLELDKTRIEAALKAIDLPTKVRAENLSLNDFAKLAVTLREVK